MPKKKTSKAKIVKPLQNQITKLLDSSNVRYKVLEHRKVYTAFTEAETQHIDPKTVVKTVFVKFSKPSVHLLADGKISVIKAVLVAVPAKHRVDFKKIAKVINEHAIKSYKLLLKKDPKTKKPTSISVKIADEKDILKTLKTKVGLLHPFSQLFGLPLLFDKKLSKNKKLIFPAGSYTQSLEITTKDFLKIMTGLEGNFTE